MSRKTLMLLFCISLFFSLAGTVLAQAEVPLTLRLSRTFGYSSGTGDIQGTFTIGVSGPEDLTRVIFYIDDVVMGEVVESPFALKFRTGDYPLGLHTLKAVGYTSTGTELQSNEQRREFVSADEGMKTAGKIIFPLLGIVVLSILVSVVIPAILGKGKKGELPLGAPRSYGVFGGTICPKCSRPFGMHVWGLNLLVGKLDRCPYCGKWSLVSRVHPTLLREAEEAELELVEQAPEQAGIPQERLIKEIEDSRYQDVDG